jgi:iron(III) transport system substrate-binding protein
MLVAVGEEMLKSSCSQKVAFAIAIALPVMGAPGAAWAQGALNLYCSVQIEWCQAIVTSFGKDTGIKVNMTQKGSGEALAQIRAEKENPKGDAWFGGTGDPHLIAAGEDLTQEMELAAPSQLQSWAQGQWTAAKKRTVGIYAGALGFGFNKELLAKRKLAEPQCWADLLKSEYKGEIQMANPNSSGTAYTMIATIVQLMGEERAFAYMRRLHDNINAYTKSGTGPIKAVARGETAVSISFVHDAVVEANAGFPVSYGTPCEGTGYEIGSLSVIKGARNLANAKRFHEWSLTPAAQKLGFDVAKQLQMPSHKEAPLPPNAPDLSKMKLIAYDFVKYGSSTERNRLLDLWNKEIGSLPK